MKCPTCRDTDLLMTDRQGIEIDYCPTCRGVWLDRGELDKLIERAHSFTTETRRQESEYRNEIRRRDDDDDDYRREGYRHYDDDDYRKHKYGKKRGGLLGELFDFG